MIKKPKRVALYLRVSKDGSTTENQRQELMVVAERHGWHVVAEFEDEGISGAKGRDKRPAFDALLKGVARREFDMVAAWAVDRLGRSLTDLLDFMNELRAKGVDLYLNDQALDTSTPSGRAMFQMCGVFAEFELAMIQARVHAGLARAKEQYKRKTGKDLKLGRPSGMTPAKDQKARELLAQGVGVNKIGRHLGVGTGTIQKIKKQLKAA
jgi:DNA invertase Pin-like site-specific DNA recombinase